MEIEKGIESAQNHIDGESEVRGSEFSVTASGISIIEIVDYDCGEEEGVEAGEDGSNPAWEYVGPDAVIPHLFFMGGVELPFFGFPEFKLFRASKIPIFWIDVKPPDRFG